MFWSWSCCGCPWELGLQISDSCDVQPPRHWTLQATRDSVDHVIRPPFDCGRVGSGIAISYKCKISTLRGILVQGWFGFGLCCNPCAGWVLSRPTLCHRQQILDPWCVNSDIGGTTGLPQFEASDPAKAALCDGSLTLQGLTGDELNSTSMMIAGSEW